MSIASREIKKSFKDNEVIRDFSFTLKEGRITFLLGPNGCGKTTWIRIALGLETPDSGKVLFAGKPLGQVRNQVSVVFDEPPVYSHLSGYDNLFLLSRRNTKTDYAKQVLSELKLTDELMKKSARAFSLGQRHRLAVACALIRQANYILLDEPAVGLDVESWETVKEMLQSEARRGRVILLTGHNYDLLAEIVDDLLVISNGVITFDGTLAGLQQTTEIYVQIKTRAEQRQMEEMGFVWQSEYSYQKKYANKQEFDRQLVELQKRGIIIEHIDIKVPGLKDLYQSLLAQ